jgi:hypothetical protein
MLVCSVLLVLDAAWLFRSTTAGRLDPPGSGRHSVAVGETSLAVGVRCSGVETNPAAGERRDVCETGVATGAAVAGQRSTRETDATRALMSRRRSRSRPFPGEKLKDVLTIHKSH